MAQPQTVHIGCGPIILFVLGLFSVMLAITLCALSIAGVI